MKLNYYRKLWPYGQNLLIIAKFSYRYCMCDFKSRIISGLQFHGASRKSFLIEK